MFESSIRRCIKSGSSLPSSLTSHLNIVISTVRCKMNTRVHNRFGGMRDLAFFRGDIRDLS